MFAVATASLSKPPWPIQVYISLDYIYVTTLELEGFKGKNLTSSGKICKNNFKKN